MNNFMIMEPTNETFQNLIANGIKYSVPRFQRDYTWEQEQWEDLWNDIETLSDDSYHYIGYIVLQKKGKHKFEIIDGQQRLVTLSLIVLAAMRQIKKLSEKNIDIEDNKERLSVLSEKYIGSKNSISLKVDSKLSLNRNNGKYFKIISSTLDAPNKRGLTRTNRLLLKAFSFFSEKKVGNTGSEIAEFIEKLTSSMFFTKIIVGDSLNAYTVFETLNARGVQLSTPDLLKNYIFSVIAQNNDILDEDLNDLDESWSEIISQLGESNFTDFIRYHYNLKNKLVTKKTLFKSLKKDIITSTKAYEYLNSLDKYAPIYASLLNPYDDWWQNQEYNFSPIRKYLEAFKLFNIKQVFTILMIAFTKFSDKEFIKLVRYMYILTIRYNIICQFSANEQERLYNQISIKISNDIYKRASHIKNSDEFKNLYPEDKVFSDMFEFHKIPSRQFSKKIRFLLSEIEIYLGRDTDYTKVSLEHISPYHPEQNWSEYFGEGINDITDRLGNLILLKTDFLKRKNFNEKKRAYLETDFILAQKVSEYKEWNLQSVNKYQSWLAEQAVNTWKLDLYLNGFHI